VQARLPLFAGTGGSDRAARSQ